MGISLNGLTPSQTFEGLIKVGNNTNVDGTAKVLSDGAGTDLPMEVSTAGVNFTGTVTQNGNPIYTPPSGVAGAIQFSGGSAFASDVDNLFWDDTNNRLGIGTNSPTNKLTITDGANTINFGSDGGGAFIRPSGNMSIYSANSSQFAFITNNGIGVGVNPSSRFHIKGGGSTSATTALLVQNSSNTNTLQVRDDGYVIASIISTSIIRDWSILIASGGGFNINTSNNYLYSTYSKNVFGGTNADSDNSAIITIKSTTQGLLPPRMTTTQKNAISSPAAGLVVYDSTTNKLCCYNGTSWNDLF